MRDDRMKLRTDTATPYCQASVVQIWLSHSKEWKSHLLRGITVAGLAVQKDILYCHSNADTLFSFTPTTYICPIFMLKCAEPTRLCCPKGLCLNVGLSPGVSGMMRTPPKTSEWRCWGVGGGDICPSPMVRFGASSGTPRGQLRYMN